MCRAFLLLQVMTYFLSVLLLLVLQVLPAPLALEPPALPGSVLRGPQESVLRVPPEHQMPLDKQRLISVPRRQWQRCLPSMMETSRLECISLRFNQAMRQLEKVKTITSWTLLMSLPLLVAELLH